MNSSRRSLVSNTRVLVTSFFISIDIRHTPSHDSGQVSFSPENTSRHNIAFARALTIIHYGEHVQSSRAFIKSLESTFKGWIKRFAAVPLIIRLWIANNGSSSWNLPSRPVKTYRSLDEINGNGNAAFVCQFKNELPSSPSFVTSTKLVAA